MKDKKFSDVVVEHARLLPKYLQEYPQVFEKQKTELDKIWELMENSRAIHVYGKGRSGNAAVGLALRLKHFGYNVWFIGDVVKERIKSGDAVLLFTGSGETTEVVDVAKRAKQDDAVVIAITSYKESTVAKYAEVIFYLPGGLEKRKGWEYLEAQLAPESSKEIVFYGGGEFEAMAYLFQETLISAIGKHKEIPMGAVMQAHERDAMITQENS